METMLGRTMYTPREPYPLDWVDIAEAARERSGHRCVLCGMQGLLPEDYDDWRLPDNKARIIEVHHADGDPANCAEENLQPLCHQCHQREHNHMREKRRREAAQAAGQKTLTI